MYPNDIFKNIIREQSLIVGEALSKSRAIGTGSISFGPDGNIHIQDEPKLALEKLIRSYEEIFGQSSLDVCVDVLHRMPYTEIELFLPDRIKTQLTNQKKL